MKSSKYLLLFVLVFLSATLLTYGQQGQIINVPSGTDAREITSRLEEENRLAKTRQLERERRSIENAKSDRLRINEIALVRQQIKINILELDKATEKFLILFKEGQPPITNKAQAKEVAKVAERIAKYSSYLRYDLDLKDLKIAPTPIKISETETPNEQLVKLAKNINESMEEIKASIITYNQDSKRRILAQYLVNLETYAKYIKEIAKKQD